MIPHDALSAALAAVPGAVVAGRPAPRVTPLAGGLVNRSFRVTTGAGDFVLRLNAASATTHELGVDREVGHAAQRLAASAGVAPRLLSTAPDGSWQLSEFVAGEVADAALLAAPRTLERLGTTLARLRAVDGLPCGPSLIERARRLVARATLRVPGEAETLAALLGRAERGWQLAGAPARAAHCLVHSDPGPGNVVLPPGPGPALLLDWEYAHRGDPLQDPAAWLQACPALRGQESRLLRACALEGLADAPMLAGMAQVYDSIERAWALLAATAAGVPPVGRAN